MSGWLDTLFGNLPPRPQQPSSRGAMPGLQPYQQMPDPKASVTDERGQTDQAFWMKNFIDPSNEGKYQPSYSGGGKPSPYGNFDPMTGAGPSLAQGLDAEAVAPYNPSYPQNWRPPYSRQAAYRASPVLHNEYGDDIGPMGPPLPPRGPTGTSRDAQMPYLGPHLPISPGDPGWTSPPSPSGPHNPQGDPDRPGYGSPVMPMDATSQPSYQQLVNFLQSWRGGTS